MPANSGLTFGGLSRRQQCEAATLIFTGILSTGLAVAMLVGTVVIEPAPAPVVTDAQVSHVADVALRREAGAAIAVESGTRPVVRASTPRAASRHRAEAPRLVLASALQPVATVPPSQARADSGRSRFARLLFGDGGRHVVRPFPVVETASADVR